MPPVWEINHGQFTNRTGQAAVSPNIQIYRPQLTSVLSIANRITGIVLSIAAVGLVAWFIAAADSAL